MALTNSASLTSRLTRKKQRHWESDKGCKHAPCKKTNRHHVMVKAFIEFRSQRLSRSRHTNTLLFENTSFLMHFDLPSTLNSQKILKVFMEKPDWGHPKTEQ